MNNIYIHTEEVHNLRAPGEIVPSLMELVNPRSILDVGCGPGTWLNVFEEHGVTDYVGIDGAHMNRSLLKISAEKFLVQELNTEWHLDRRFDLVISLEVAEHLERGASDLFVETLTNHGDMILFSAAVPGQGGQNHVNEQWLSYWAEIFKRQNYLLFDVLRPLFWNNPGVEVWYKQNMVLFCRKGHRLEQLLRSKSSPYVDIVHPELFSFYAMQAARATLHEEGMLGVRSAFSALVKSFKRTLK